MLCELHAASAFSFLEGASLPEDLVERAARLGYRALALCDRDGVSGAPRFYKAAKQAGVKPLVGCEISLAEGRVDAGAAEHSGGRAAAGESWRPRKGAAAPPPGSHRLTVLAENRRGYQNLCRLLTRMHLRAGKGEGRAAWADVEEFSGGLVALLANLDDADPVRSIFSPHNLYVELQRRHLRGEEAANQARLEYARRYRLPLAASNGVRYADPSRAALFDVLACIRQKTTLDKAGRRLQPNAERYLKPPGEMSRLFADLPQALAQSEELAQRLDFTLDDLGYRFPDYPLPRGETMNSYLRKLAEQGARERYRPYSGRARRQIEHELNVIEKLDLAGYFLIVWDMVRFCRENGILAQGRGSAANSAVCYGLGITAVDPVGMDLLFERFLSEERGEWPDIDLDLPSGPQREKVLQYVYRRYGKRGAAMTANVITYRGKSAVREVGKALGFPEEMLGRLSNCIHSFEYTDDADQLANQVRNAGFDVSHSRVRHLVRLCLQIQNLPRHLGQHSGGVVLCRGPLDSIVPLENASMPDRVVIQWDKDDCAGLGVIKVDLLGLGMMAALEESISIIRSRGGDLDLARLPAGDRETYAMIQKADTVGVFQIESRAQMATLPRLRPECFYDLVVEVAIIRPGPIVGDMVHPYINRRLGREPVTYPHPKLEPILRRTLGVPLFQEQLLRVAMTAAGFSGGEAEELRRAMGFKRSAERMRAIETKLRRGLAANGIGGEAAERIVRSITSFALYGFPESHAASFALLAYASAYLKAHYPATFTAALLNCQPMGFYSPAVLVKDAQRHGVRVRPIDVRHSDVKCRVEADRWDGRTARPAPGMAGQGPAGPPGGRPALRLGLMFVRGLRAEAAASIERERSRRPFSSVNDLVRRTALRKPELEALAEIGALNSLGEGLHRREALWQIEKACRPAGPLFEQADASRGTDGNGQGVRAPAPAKGEAAGGDPCPLDPMTPVERLEADYRGAGMTTGPHPMRYFREALQQAGALSAADLVPLPHGRRVRAAGAVIVRQRPGTAKGFVFLTLEDETGVANIIIRPDLFQKHRVAVTGEPFLLVEGVLQKQDNVISVRAEKIQALQRGVSQPGARNFC